MFPALGQEKAFSSFFDNSSTTGSSFAVSVGIASHDGTNIFFDCMKVVAQFQAKRELSRRALQKEVAVESLLSLQDTSSSFPVPVYQSPACHDHFKDYDDWLFAGWVARHGTSAKADQNSEIDSEISQTLHTDYSKGN